MDWLLRELRQFSGAGRRADEDHEAIVGDVHDDALQDAR
jgi:hypothetical protein